MWRFALVSRIVIYFVVIHNDFFEHFCVARYWHDESSCTTLAQLKMNSWNLSIPMHFDSNIIWMLGVKIYTIAEAGKYQGKDVEKEHVS